MGARGGGLVAREAVPEVEPEPIVAAVEEPIIKVEAPRERLRYLRADGERSRAPMRAETTPMAERLLETLTSTLAALAAKPPQPVTLQVAPSHVTLEVPPIELSQPPAHVEVHVPERSVEVNVPEQQAPVVNITNEIPEQLPPNVLVAAPDVTVQAPAPPAPVIEVNLPEQPAPVVNVQVDVPRPRPVRVEKQSDGTVRYVPEPE